MTDPFEALTEGEGYRATVEAVRRLAGHQVVSLERAWIELTGSEPEKMTPDHNRDLRFLLYELGYEEQWVAPLGQGRMLHRWVRGHWPIDFDVVRRGGATAFLSAS